MISNEEKEGQWYYLAVKKLAALFYRITSKNKSDFYCLNCLLFSVQKLNLDLMKKYVKIKISVEL